MRARAARLAWRRWIWRGRARWARTRRVRSGLGVLPMPPSQILLTDLLYVSSQMAIPTDNVDPEQVAQPSRWDVGLIRRQPRGQQPDC